MDERSEAARTRARQDGRSWFEQFVERINAIVSHAPFFFVCLGIVFLWAVSLPLFADLKSWQVVIHTVTSVISLLLLVLLENSGRRAEEAAQEKLNVLAEALAALMKSHAHDDRELRDAVAKLEDAVGLEEKH